MDRFAGKRTPASRAASSAPIAIKSLPAKTALRRHLHHVELRVVDPRPDEHHRRRQPAQCRDRAGVRPGRVQDYASYPGLVRRELSSRAAQCSAWRNACAILSTTMGARQNLTLLAKGGN